jgi:peptidoglycan hydrolase-like protein with peptidoglycan-binding domain
VPGLSATADIDVMPEVRRGAQGQYTAWAQRKLGVPVDGDFGPATEAAVIALQTAAGLPPTGVIDVRTFCALAWR